MCQCLQLNLAGWHSIVWYSLVSGAPWLDSWFIPPCAQSKASGISLVGVVYLYLRGCIQKKRKYLVQCPHGVNVGPGPGQKGKIGVFHQKAKRRVLHIRVCSPFELQQPVWFTRIINIGARHGQNHN